MKRAHLVVGVAFGAALAAYPAVSGALRSEPQFPHERHARLFPVCEGCHSALVGDVDGDSFPQGADCARCHDGSRQPVVSWQARTPHPSNLRFSHARHLTATTAAGEPAECHACHDAGGAGERMQVTAAEPERCIGCHAHRVDTHLSDEARCDRCHVSVARAADLSSARVAAFPKPAWHATDDFIATHGARAAGPSCVVCHARETCERCHANGAEVPAIREMERDERVSAVERTRTAAYPRPADHGTAGWTLAHGAAALAGAATCANCHTRPSCTGCHPQQNRAIASLPEPLQEGARGVTVTSTAHGADIVSRHGSLAATEQVRCARCHGQDTCTSCHAGTDSRAFHAANFIERHGAEVFARGSDCQSCHTTETFCRGCHQRTGIAAQASMNAAFHTAQPMWVLSHGQAARVGLEACASCHRQNDCVRCHSAAGGWGVNPHGSGYGMGSSASRNAATCRWCHTGQPAGRQP
ncbi:MAG TPA: hypothetical protein VK928_09340 [Longimicrobiales bacterium]|nr:hypothetical protein [Longimicrobiales bacterium]